MCQIAKIFRCGPGSVSPILLGRLYLRKEKNIKSFFAHAPSPKYFNSGGSNDSPIGRLKFANSISNVRLKLLIHLAGSYVISPMSGEKIIFLHKKLWHSEK